MISEIISVPGSLPWSSWQAPDVIRKKTAIAPPPSQLGTVLKNVLVFGGIGAAVGAAAGALALWAGGSAAALAITAALGANAGMIFGVLEGLFLSGRDEREHEKAKAQVARLNGRSAPPATSTRPS